jgi:small subunit ribosomal protein S6
MRRYETIFISDPDLSETDRGQLFEKTKKLIPDYNGMLVVFDEWGTKKLAYDIKKKNRGYYVLIDYCGNGDLVDEMERSFRIDDRVLKFMTIVLDKEADPEAVQMEIDKAEEAAAAKKAEIEASKEKAAAASAETESTDSTESDGEEASTQTSKEE